MRRQPRRATISATTTQDLEERTTETAARLQETESVPTDGRTGTLTATVTEGASAEVPDVLDHGSANATAGIQSSETHAREGRGIESLEMPEEERKTTTGTSHHSDPVTGRESVTETSRGETGRGTLIGGPSQETEGVKTSTTVDIAIASKNGADSIALTTSPIAMLGRIKFTKLARNNAEK